MKACYPLFFNIPPQDELVPKDLAREFAPTSTACRHVVVSEMATTSDWMARRCVSARSFQNDQSASRVIHGLVTCHTLLRIQHPWAPLNRGRRDGGSARCRDLIEIQVEHF